MTAATAGIHTETVVLLGHSLSRDHETHRAELPGPIERAGTVRSAQAEDPQAPEGVAEGLAAPGRGTGEFMAMEEIIPSPAMRTGVRPGAGYRIAVMRTGGGDHAGRMKQTRDMTGTPTPPDHACGSRRLRYAGTNELRNHPAAHVALQNDVLFPRLEQG
ncbi:hypothetical protein STA1M1_17530 [Sinisalibacter aestuarii]|uniref:Uncharacterized protein n=2 Tax=Sinisalibacter aestuarii TaxID=2949426 RepID=A0ABQ5LSA8_9RHOB|nr:hypothetical protein STA1M1_17530 [Sinisalibacter aestuarii]